MTFTVTYRGKDGALYDETVAAADRAGCVAECRRRGIAPTKIREGGKGRDKRGPSRSAARVDARPPSQRRLTGNAAILAAVVLVAVGVGVWCWFDRGKAQPPKTTETAAPPAKAKPKAEKPQPPMPKPKPVATNATPKTAEKPPEPKRDMWMGREIVSTKVVTNGTDLIITRVDTEDKIHKEYTSTHKRLFTNPVDITLSILLTSPENALTPPLPPLGSRARDTFIEALKKPIEITEDDSPEDRRIKELVSAAREEMLEELVNGRTVNEVIEEHCTFVDEKNKLRAEAMAQYKKLVAEGDGAIAEEFRAKANEMLAQKGAKPLKSLDEIQQERISRREEKQK